MPVQKPRHKQRSAVPVASTGFGQQRQTVNNKGPAEWYTVHCMAPGSMREQHTQLRHDARASWSQVNTQHLAAAAAEGTSTAATGQAAVGRRCKTLVCEKIAGLSDDEFYALVASVAQSNIRQ